LYSFSQDYGYFGKKNTLSLNGIISNPFLYNLFSSPTGYKSSGNNVVLGRSQVDYGYSASYSHYFSGSFGIGAEIGMAYGRITSPIYYQFSSGIFNDDYAYGEFNVEQFKISTFTIMPKLEYTFSGEQLPIGINHQFGVGVTTSKLIEKDYKIRTIEYFSSNGTAFNPATIAPYSSVGKFRNLTILYAFNVRTPITKSLMINYGLRYTLNTAITGFGAGILPNSGSYQGELVESIKEGIRQKRSTSVLNFTIGLTFLF
jgi:hypothetical protein